MEKCSSNLRFERKILGAGTSGKVKVGTEERLRRKRLSLEEETGEGASREKPAAEHVYPSS